ncbi:formate transporter [Virgibacillus profundi]|uniref:Formate transporter n=1 Tax=Virgibacillus profundi TaxID=2024555 RepID=A0A2A2I9R0_9BACI|nr:formate/nitrite transporter family protein [Virgibacillus profundi]PAV28459.1 formate transporter [Virgibacillus profundi]PXY52632.1 formate/nitrite transporter family protein [Virgibacillus profundi]
MDYIKPQEVVRSIAVAGGNKAKLPINHILIKGALSGAFLGYSTTLAFTASIQTGLDIVGAAIFPVGFVLILLLNLELVTGSFAMLPIAKMRKKTTAPLIARNFTWAFIGNLLGSLFYAALFSIYITKFGHVEDSVMIQKIITVAESKTLDYQAYGSDGMIVLFVKALLCNWMVTMGAIMAFTSHATIGKIVAMWLPVFIFFAQGFEHAVVNMFVIPAAMMIGADISFGDWWLWNQIPVTIGNFISGFLFTALALHMVTKEDPVSISKVKQKAS